VAECLFFKIVFQKDYETTVVLKSLAERRVVTAGEKKLIMDPLSPLKDSGTAVSK
jgi:hypothetical protein